MRWFFASVFGILNTAESQFVKNQGFSGVALVVSNHSTIMRFRLGTI